MATHIFVSSPTCLFAEPAIEFEKLSEMDKAPRPTRASSSTIPRQRRLRTLTDSRVPTAADDSDELFEDDHQLKCDEGFGPEGLLLEDEDEYEVTPEDLLEDWLQAEHGMDLE
jgi:hypothetical protein